MKRVMQNGLLVFFLLTALQAMPQSKQQKQIEEKLVQLKNAMVNGDSLMLDKLVSANLVYRHSSGNIDNKQTFISKLASGQSDFVTMDISDQKVSLVNKKTAIVIQTLNAKIMDGGKPGEVSLYVMLVWQKQQGTWKLIARQAAKKL